MRTEGRNSSVVPVTVVCVIILVAWYIAAIFMNTVVAEPKIAALGGGFANTVNVSWSLDRPVIPAPHQVVVEVWNTVFTIAPWKVKSLVYHVWVTLSSTLLGFVLGTLLGIGLAVAIVHFKLLSKSLMPWIIASQTIPILAIAPMIIVVLGSVGLTGLIPKSIISMYLCFFPVAIGMVKGLTSPDPMQLDLMRTYNASVSQVLWKLRFPAAMPFLFASLKVAVAIALTGPLSVNSPLARNPASVRACWLVPITGRPFRYGRRWWPLPPRPPHWFMAWAGSSASSTGRWERGHEAVQVP